MNSLREKKENRERMAKLEELLSRREERQAYWAEFQTMPQYDFDFLSIGLPTEERYLKTDDGKVLVISSSGIYDIGYDFNEFVKNDDISYSDARGMYDDFIIEHLEHKYERTFTIRDPYNRMSTRLRGKVQAVDDEGKEFTVNFTASATEDGKVMLNTYETYQMSNVRKNINEQMQELVMPELKKYNPELEYKVRGGGTETHYPQFLGNGITFQDVNEYYLRTQGYGADMSVYIDGYFGELVNYKEEMESLILELEKILSDNNYNGMIVLNIYSKDNWDLIMADEHDGSAWALSKNRVFKGFGNNCRHENNRNLMSFRWRE